MTFIILLIGELLMVMLVGIKTILVDVPVKLTGYGFIFLFWFSGGMNGVELQDFETNDLDKDLLV